MRYAARVDKNQTAIVNGLRKAGCSVAIAQTRNAGFPDLIVGYNGQNWLIELKEGKGKLSQEQETFRATWKGSVHLARSLEDALSIVLKND